MTAFALLVVAKAPVPGFAKTRLCPPATPEQAAAIAAASLLDTLDAVLATPGAVPVVAFTGALDQAANRTEITAALRHTTVFPQRGDGFGERLANAHADTAARCPGLPVLQIGMDTPQVTPDLLAATAARLDEREAVLGPADDGGWWALGLRDPLQAAVLVDVPMSRPDTGALTRKALDGLTIGIASRLSDVDTMADAIAVVSRTNGRFATAVLGQAA
ncbi:TIGR04282 family arsenosugar biosynthesis glycosyltransferase [Amycolatopsis magusensis]|uniref:TIGR04282 family arsenosugar biosynthesis glycosyltransferase n=1 Tax=Amycolatopsis magusensis TaxID=882444 RepID=UPI003793FECE